MSRSSHHSVNPPNPLCAVKSQCPLNQKGTQGHPNWPLRRRRQVRQSAGVMKASQKKKRWGDATLAIHAGQEKFRLGESVGTTIERTANFTFKNTEEMKR